MSTDRDHVTPVQPVKRDRIKPRRHAYRQRPLKLRLYRAARVFDAWFPRIVLYLTAIGAAYFVGRSLASLIH